MIICKKQFLKSFYFLSSLDNKSEKEILHFKKITLIYKPQRDLIIKNIINIKKFCKTNNIKLLIMDNIKLAIKMRCDGIVLPSSNKKIIYKYNFKKNFDVIGIVHSQMEYFTKIQQNCQKIMLSPFAFNKKFKTNKILGPIKFNLMSLYWKSKLVALGGIDYNNMKKINLTNADSIAFQSLIKKPTY
jgi:thiamine-phosphate pyrophosphorylase